MKKLSTVILSLGLLVAFGVPAFSHALPSPTVADVDPNGDATSNSCVTLSSADLRYRATDYVTGGEVSLLQDFLISKGFLSGQPTGFFGNMTLSAVKSFQKSAGFVSTGYVGNLTKAKIKELSCGGATALPVNTTNVTTGVGVPSVSLINETNYSDIGNNGGAFVRLSIKGYPTNKQVDHWVLGYTCQSGVTLDTGSDSGKPLLCNGTEEGKDARSFYSRNMFDPTADYLMITAVAQNKNLFSSQIKFTLDARDANDNSLGSADSKIIKLSGYQAPCPSGQTWNGSACAIVTKPIPYITSVAGLAAGNGEIYAGGKVGIQGTNLAGYKDATNIYIGGKVCTITQLGNDLIYCTAPSDLMIGNIYDLYINTAGIGGDKVTSNIVQVKVLSKFSTTQPSITVLSPNGGESFVRGNNLTGSFTTSNISYGTFCEVAIFGKKPDGNFVDTTISTLNTSATDKQVYFGKIPSDLVPAGSYKIRVDCGGGKLIAQDQSDSYFTITNPVTPTPTPLTVLTPVNPTTHGDTFSTGETVPLAWSSKEFGVNRIYLLSETGNKIATILATNDNGVFPYTGSTYSWKIPENIPTGTYKVRVIIGIEGFSSSPVGDSGTFRIRNTSATIPVQLPSTTTQIPAHIITVYSPQGGEQLATGQVYRIRWNNSVGVNKVTINLRGEDGKIVTIAALPNNPNFYDWTPTTVMGGGKYKIEVVEVGDTSTNSRAVSVSGSSATYFSVAGESMTALPSIHLLQPVGGETFTAPGTMQVRWEAFNLPANTTIDSLSFSLVTSAGTIIPVSVTKDSQFAPGFNGMWNTTGRGAVTAMKIPASVETGSYKLRVSCPFCGANVNSLSNAFNITGQTAPAAPTNMTSNLLDGLKLINPSLYR